MHAALLDKYDRKWRNPHYTIKHTGKECQACPHPLPRVFDDSVIRGFMHWAFTGELPSDATIQTKDFPVGWEAGDEEEPLTTRMAIELAKFGWCLSLLDLVNKAVTVLFAQYEPDNMIPDSLRFGQVHHIPSLRRLFQDIYLTRCTKPLNAAEYPTSAFLNQLHQRICERNAAGNPLSIPLKLSDYHFSTLSHDDYCNCKRPAEFEAHEDAD